MIGVTSPAQCCCDLEAPSDICIRMITYRFLCCEQRTYLYVASPCPIEAIRINGTTIATPGTTEFGGWPSTTPTITIGEDEISGVILTSSDVDCCPALNGATTETPYAIAVAAPTCTYVVEVDTCETTYSCSLTYCLPRQILIDGQGLGPYANSDTCAIETELGTSTRTITNEIGVISIPELSIDFCIPNEDGIEYNLGDWSATVTNQVTVGLNTTTSTDVYEGTLYLWIPPYSRCETTGGTTGLTLQIFFTGTRTTTTTDILGGTYESVYDATYMIIGGITIQNCNDLVDTYGGLIFCNELGPPAIPDAMVCDCVGTITYEMTTSWC